MKSFFRTLSVPFVLLALCGLSFAIFIPRLGFYYDDWPVVMMTHLKGAGGFWAFYSFDRPFNAWNFIVTTPFLQDRPLAWHLFTFGMRWLGTLGLWLALRLLWPRQARQTAWIALLFAVYPIFDQQAIAVCYSTHWIAFTLYTFSLAGMLLAVRKPGWAIPLTVLSTLAAALQIFTIEYFLGLELLRPLLLWIVISREEKPAVEKLKSTALRWLPYLGVFALFVVWRMFFLKLSGQDPNRPELVYGLLSQPLATLLNFAQIIVQDFIKILVGAWYQAADPQEITLGDRTVLFAWGVGLLTALGTALYLFFSQDGDDDIPAGEPHWTRQALLVGVIAILVGMLPVWALGKQVFSGLYGGRYGMAAMPGAAMLLVAFFDWLTPRRAAKAALLGLLVGVAVSFHVRTGATYATAWSNELQFYWQLYWRAPQLSAPTAVLSDNEILKYMGRDSTSAAINTLYSQPVGTAELQYWFFELYHDVGEERAPKLERGIPLQDHLRSLNFKADSLNSLAIYYKPGAGRCLWALGPLDADNPELSPITIAALPASDLGRIQPQSPPGFPPLSVFGAEPPRTWCYYYEKAELARQQEKWEEVVGLEEEAAAKGFAPANLQEWLPFVEGRGRTGDWQAAEKRSLEIFKEREELAPRICNLWKRLAAESDVPSKTLDALSSDLKCVFTQRAAR